MNNPKEKRLLNLAKPAVRIWLRINELQEEIKKKTTKIKKAPGLEKTNELQKEIKKLKEEAKQERKKSKKIGKASIQAVRDLIHDSKDLVRYIGPGYSSIGDVDYEDLISEGNISLLKAIDKFDVSSKNRLATYSGIWIRTYIKSFINKSQFIEQNPVAERKKK